MPKNDYSNRSYSIVPYNPEWPNQFQEIRKEIAPIFGDLAVAIEHVGSTSIPDMAGKPTIDILVIVKKIEAVDTLNDKMASIGYQARGEYVTAGGRLFTLEENGDRIINIHCYPPDHRKTERFLSLRDFLKSHPDEMQAYKQLKLDLYEKYPMAYGAYRQEKDAYVKELDARAMRWFESQKT